jgi:hypothetical protein
MPKAARKLFFKQRLFLAATSFLGETYFIHRCRLENNCNGKRFLSSDYFYRSPCCWHSIALQDAEWYREFAREPSVRMTVMQFVTRVEMGQ